MGNFLSVEWDRQRNDEGKLEPAAWWDRFERFRLAGPTRSVLSIYNAERADKGKSPARSIPSSWQEAIEAWRWRERAAAWDESQIAARKIEFEQERLARRRRRQAVLDRGFDKLDEMIESLDPKKSSWHQAAALMRALYENERAEFDDEPDMRLKLAADEGGPPIININLAKVEKRSDASDD